MKKAFLPVAAMLGLLGVHPAFAAASAEDLTAKAVAEAQAAIAATDMEEVKMHLQRAANCLVGRDSGSFYAAVGGPCNDRLNVVASATSFLQKKKLDGALTQLLSGEVQTDINVSHDHAEDAIALIESSKTAPQ